MNKLKLLLITLCFSSIQAVAQVPISNLVAHYALDGDVQDLSEYNNHGVTINASNTIDRFGNPNSGFQFDGQSQYIEIPDQDQLSISTTGELSISIWMRPDTLDFDKDEGDGYIHWFGKGEGVGANGEQEYHLRIYNLNHPTRPNRTSCYVFNPEGGLGAGSYVQEPISVGEWIHIVATYDFPNNEIKLYKNGVLKDTDTFSSYAITPENGSAPMRIGTRDFRSFFQGAIDDLCVFNKRLTAAEVSNIYQLEDNIVTANWLSVDNDLQTIFPNPSQTGLFMIDQDIESYIVTNINGQTIIRNEYNTKNQIDLSGQPNGVYLLNAMSKSGQNLGQEILMIQ